MACWEKEAVRHLFSISTTSVLASLARFLPPLFDDRLMTRMAARINLPS
jgi:hypothetical protein